MYTSNPEPFLTPPKVMGQKVCPEENEALTSSYPVHRMGVNPIFVSLGILRSPARRYLLYEVVYLDLKAWARTMVMVQ